MYLLQLLHRMASIPWHKCKVGGVAIAVDIADAPALDEATAEEVAPDAGGGAVHGADAVALVVDDAVAAQSEDDFLALTITTMKI